MGATVISQYLHRPNNTELGLGNTHETYLLVNSNFDLSLIFPPSIEVSVTDSNSGKSYPLKAALGSEFRINQMGPIYRDYAFAPGDEITFTAIQKNGNTSIYFTVNNFKRVVLTVDKKGAEVTNIDRLNAFQTAERKYQFDYEDRGNKCSAVIEFKEAKKKRADSPKETDFYSILIDGAPIPAGTYYITLGENITLTSLPKSTFNTVELNDSCDGGIIAPLYINSFTSDVYKKETELLLNKKNLVLTGAPGTGKTFAAKQIAATIVSHGERTWEQLTDEDKKRVGFTQFHPSYDYTDFVEGLRPDSKSNFVRTDGIFKSFCKRACDVSIIFNECYEQILEELEFGKLTLETDSKSIICRDGKLLVRSKDGRPAGEEKKSISVDKLLTLYKYCVSNSINESNFLSKEQATLILMDSGMETYSADSYLLLVLKELLQRSEKRISNNKVADNYVFIIDEINRGELSKIFGELFYSIEPDYRGEAGRVTTQYANMIPADDVFAQGFYIPENVFILGTMNDVDRGVEAMDFAIRRRFAWHEVTAEESAKRMGIIGEAKAKMDAINEIIKNDLGSAYCIGGSYFRGYNKEGQESTWENHLHGIIYEYYRGEPKVDDKVKLLRDTFFSAKENENNESTDHGSNKEEYNN